MGILWLWPYTPTHSTLCYTCTHTHKQAGQRRYSAAFTRMQQSHRIRLTTLRVDLDLDLEWLQISICSIFVELTCWLSLSLPLFWRIVCRFCRSTHSHSRKDKQFYIPLNWFIDDRIQWFFNVLISRCRRWIYFLNLRCARFVLILFNWINVCLEIVEIFFFVPLRLS